MRQDINRFKNRTDYTKTLRPRPMALKYSLDGLRPVKPAHQRRASTKPASKPGEDRSTLSFRLSLPTFRRPPDSGDLPSRNTVRWIFIIIFSATFFIIGYHNLWHITHKSTIAPVAGLIWGKGGRL